MKTISPRRILAAILLLALLLTALPISILAAEMPFTDVPENKWYYEDVRLAVEGGLVNGKRQHNARQGDGGAARRTPGKVQGALYKDTHDK